MDAIYTYSHYAEDHAPRLAWPQPTGRGTAYNQWLDHNYQLHHDHPLPSPQLQPDTASPQAFVNHGRWLWQCPACLTAVQVAARNGEIQASCCPACFNDGFVLPRLPAGRAAIEAELLSQPGYRHNAPFRNWEPGWSLDYLRERTAIAQAKLAAGETFVRSASIGAPRTWAVGEVLTAANMNTFIREIQKDLIGVNGPIEYLDALVLASLTETERDALAAMDGMLLYNATRQRVERYEGGSWFSNARSARSTLFAANVTTTMTHDLGSPPSLFTMEYERVQDSDYVGYSLGDVLKVSLGRGRLAVWDVAATEYRVRLAGFNSTTQVFVPNLTADDPRTESGIRLDNDPDSTDTGGGWGIRVTAFI